MTDKPGGPTQPGETINLNVNLAITTKEELSDSANRKIDEILARLTHLSRQEILQMKTFAEFKTELDARSAVAEANLEKQRTVTDSVKALLETQSVKIGALREEVAALKAGGGIDDATAAALLGHIDAINTQDAAEIDRLATAFVANNEEVTAPA